MLKSVQIEPQSNKKHKYYLNQNQLHFPPVPMTPQSPDDSQMSKTMLYYTFNCVN